MVLVTCLATWACGSRAPATPGPVQPPADQPPDGAAVIAAPDPPPPPAPPTPADIDSETTEARSGDCVVPLEPGEAIATVALSERVSPWNAPYPANESERLLFRQLYETLIRADCMGRLVAGLATSWRLDADGRTWMVTLRENARFSDGTPVTAADVRASWMRSPSGDELRPQAGRLVDSVAAVDNRTLAVRLRGQHTQPLSLAHTDLAVTKPAPDSTWPVGTRAAQLVSADDRPAVGDSVLTVARDSLPSIRFLVAAGDPRDLLENSVDLLITRDPSALDYAATLPQYQSAPLEWQRTYVLLTPARPRSSPALSLEARQRLADDAVRGEARGAQGPFWWEMAADCEVARVAPGQSVPAPRIVYDGNDPSARDLAERLVGIVRAAPGTRELLDALLPDRPRRTYQRATGLTNEALALARRRGNDAGYIVAVDSRPLDACRDLQALIETGRWLDPETIVPLVETRLHAVVRRGRSGLTAEWDGGLVLAGVKASN
jgi:hypothetical protein